MLFKLKLQNPLDHGASLDWLSAFPAESEVLYPPLTFLQPTNRIQSIESKKSGASVTIIELQPNLSAGR